ncbi:MAG: hypothetical protein LBG77_04040 [Dysgonamonadaceae bacterium]|nr:hypothetical protein [Dysgonamonadaceae bacterium]
MAQAAGIAIERTDVGIPTYARINLRNPLLAEKGVQEEMKKNSRTPEPKIPRGSISSEEFWRQGRDIVTNLCNKYGIV